MFFFCFNQRYGTDKVVWIDGTEKLCKPWDLLLVDWNQALCLWVTVSFQELIKSRYKWKGDVQVLIKKLLSKESLSLLHRFVNHRFTSYKNSLPLFFWKTVDTIINKNPLSKAQKWVEQSLIIFPTVRSLMQETTVSQRDAVSAVVLHGWSTSVQKAKAFWWIKNGEITTVYCTYSQIFQDWNNLVSITLHKQHSRRYKNQQDPRWYVPTVVRELALQYDANLSTTWYELTA